MNKRRLHHLLVRLRPISYWYFVGLFVATGFFALLALRHNNVRAIELRDELIQVDKENGDVEAKLSELRTYIYSHMNARLSNDNSIYPPIQLKYTYERLAAAEKQRVTTANEKIYNDAQKTCEALLPRGLSGSTRLSCIQQYVDTKGTRENPVPDALYKFDFVSPVWSPDLAGILVLASLVFLILLTVRVAAEFWIRSKLD